MNHSHWNYIILIVSFVFLIDPALVGQESGFKVKGKIFSAKTGLPLGDISISAVSTSAEPVNTSKEGDFEISLPVKNDQIYISYPGYKERTVFVNGREYIEIWLLHEEDISINDNVSMASREISRAEISGAIDVSNSSLFGKSPESSFDQDLQGKLGGLQTISRSGMPGEGTFSHVRGYSSLSSSSIPLVLVDGMITRSETFDDPVIHGFHYNPLVDVDKKDISSMVLLKDAVTCGLYGVKGSNGVLLINTIPPEGGKTTLDVSVSGGVAVAPPQIPLMDGPHFSSFVMEQLLNAGMNSGEIFREYPFLEYDPEYLYQSRYNNNTNWQDEVFRSGNLYDAHLTVKGGDTRARYSLTGGYLSNQAIIKNTSYKRFNFRFNSVVQVTPKLDIGFNLGYTNGRSDLMETGSTYQTNPIFASLIISPLLTVYEKDQEGISLPVYDDIADFNFSNPVAIVNGVEAYNTSSKFLGVSYLSFKISNKISARIQFGLDRLKSNEKIFIPSWGIAPQGDGSAERSMKVKENQFYSLLTEARFSYRNRFNYVHDLTVDAGARYMINGLIQDFGTAQNSATDEFKDLNSGKADEKAVGGRQEKWSWLNYYLSANYIFKDRYILTGNISLDASSKFGPEVDDGIRLAGYPYAVLPSAGIAWRISSEPFIPDIKFLDELKIRASYGLTGSDDYVNYYTRLYYITVPYNSITGFTLKSLYNPRLKWEKVKEGNVGVDLALFRERLILNADWYHARTEDMITTSSLPSYYGFNTYVSNGGTSQNNGFEFNIFVKLIDKAFTWEIDGNYSQYKNKVLSLDNDQIIISFRGGEKISKAGNPMGMFYGYESKGVFITQEEADQARLSDKSGRRFNAGDIHFRDLDNNGIIDEKDKTIIGNPHPDFTLGLSNNFSFRGFSLNLFVYYVDDADVFNYLRSQMESMAGVQNQSTAVYNRWITDGQETAIPRASYGDPMGNSRFSNRWIENGSYVRLKSITLSYTFPRKMSFVNALNIYVTGTNLITSTRYLGYDPEFSYLDGVLGQGIDYGKIPQPRSMVIGFKMGL